MSFTNIKVEKKGYVAVVSLHRPEAMNAFNFTMAKELVEFFDEINKDDSVRVVVVTGSGKAFCVGADLSGGNIFSRSQAPESGITAQAGHRDQGGAVALSIHRCRKPVIAAINGAAVGIGITMTLPMDIRIAADNAKISFAFSRRGIAMEAVSSFFLPRIVSFGKAMEWVQTGRVFLAKDEANSGLFNYVVPAEQVLTKALEIAKEIAENTSAVSLVMNKALLWAGQINGQTPEAQHLLDSRVIHWIGRQADAEEGVTSFKQKRAPKFTMSPWSDLPDFYPWTLRINIGSKL